MVKLSEFITVHTWEYLLPILLLDISASSLHLFQQTAAATPLPPPTHRTNIKIKFSKPV